MIQLAAAQPAGRSWEHFHEIQSGEAWMDTVGTEGQERIS